LKNRYLYHSKIEGKKFREEIKELTNEISPIKGEYEADESHFGPRRVHGKQGRYPV